MEMNFSRRKLTNEDIINNLNSLFSSVTRTLEGAFVNINSPTILNYLIVSCIKAFSTKKIKIDYAGDKILLNWYSLIFMSSGNGKDFLVKTINEHLLKKYYEWFETETKKLYQEQIAEYESQHSTKVAKKNNESNSNIKNIKPQKLVSEISDGTTEGVYQMARTINTSPFGSIFIIIREFGLFLANADTYQNRIIGRFCEYFDGTVTSKFIKGDPFEDNIKGINISILMHSDYTAFESELKSKFKLLMQTGFARRCMISFNQNSKKVYKSLSKKERINLIETLDKCGEDLFNIFNEVEFNACYELTDKAIDIINSYGYELNELSNEEEDSMIQREINSRSFKAIKLSALFAILNHPKDYFIYENDIETAISCVEFMSTHFKDFYNYKPAVKDQYEHAYNWFKDRLGQKFKKTTLTKFYYRDFGYSKLNFSHEFDSIMSGVKELAEFNGYLFNIERIFPNGFNYSLTKPEVKELSSNIKPLDEILNTSSDVELSKISTDQTQTNATIDNNFPNFLNF